MAKSLSKADVAAHSKPDDLWIIVDDDVYDMTKFQEEHPGEYWKMFSVSSLVYMICANSVS